jgi:hypothetical protein
LTGKCFPLINFSNGKQTQESLESGFPKTTFRKTNALKMSNYFSNSKLNFSTENGFENHNIMKFQT